MIRLTAARIVDATPREIIELAIDLERYRSIDQTIAAVHGPPLGPFGGTTELQRRVGRFRLPRQRFRVTIDRWRSLRFDQTGRWLARLLLRWSASVHLTALDEGTVIDRHDEVTVRLLGPLLEPLLRPSLADALEAEMNRLADHFNGNVVELRAPDE
jgi:hypothetical protein